MAGEWLTEKFPQFEPAIRRLAEQHLELEDEPLHLALAYLPRRDGREVSEGIFLFEVIGGIVDRLGESGDLFQAAYNAVPGLPTGFDQTLFLILTTPRELEEAITESWPLAMEIIDAVRRGDYKVLYADSVGRKVLRRIRVAARSLKRTARG